MPFTCPCFFVSWRDVSSSHLSFRPDHATLLGRTFPLLNVRRAHLSVGTVVGILTLDASAEKAEEDVILLHLTQLDIKQELLMPIRLSASSQLSHGLCVKMRRRCCAMKNKLQLELPLTLEILVLFAALLGSVQCQSSQGGDGGGGTAANLTVVGAVFCDACSSSSFSKNSYFLPGNSSFKKFAHVHCDVHCPIYLWR